MEGQQKHVQTSTGTTKKQKTNKPKRNPNSERGSKVAKECKHMVMGLQRNAFHHGTSKGPLLITPAMTQNSKVAYRKEWLPLRFNKVNVYIVHKFGLRQNKGQRKLLTK